MPGRRVRELADLDWSEERNWHLNLQRIRAIMSSITGRVEEARGGIGPCPVAPRALERVSRNDAVTRVAR